MSEINDLQRSKTEAMIISEIEVCEDCLFLAANGEISSERLASSEPEPLALITDGYSVTLGGEDQGFSWQSCEGCGSYLGGDRYAMTMWKD